MEKDIVRLVDYFSKWPDAAPLKDKTSAGVAMLLYELYILKFIASFMCYKKV